MQYLKKKNSDKQYSTNSDIKFKALMLKTSLSSYRDTYILVESTISVAAVLAGEGNNNTEVVFKYSAPFPDSISEKNNAQIGHAKEIDVKMPMYKLI